MNVILDLVIAAIGVLSIAIAAKHGFFRTLLSGSAFVIALILTVALVSPVRNMLAGTSIYDSTQESIATWVSDTVMHAVPDVENVTNAELHEYTVQNQDFAALIESLGIDKTELANKVLGVSDDGIDVAIRAFADDIGEKVASALVGLIAALLLFIVLFVCVKLLARFMSAVIKKIPVLRTADGLLGAVLGLVFGILRIFAFVSIMHLLIPVMQTSTNAFISGVAPADTLLFGFFYNINLFAFLI